MALSICRNLLVQDWDLNDDGKPDTLRLLFATPKRWLEDGKTISVERAPTAFGPVSLRVRSELSHGQVLADIDLPQRNHTQKTMLRIRVPDGWNVASATGPAGGLKVDAAGTTDLSTLSGKLQLVFNVKRGH
jgi:hypothetical protein